MVAAVAPTMAARAAGPAVRPATRSERSAIMASFTANDGSASGVHGVYVSRSDSSLAVVCVRTPEAGPRAFVFRHARSAWRYVTSGSPGSAGSTADRRIERACG